MVVTRTGMERPGAEAEAEAQERRCMEEAGIIVTEAVAEALRDMMGTVHLCEASIRQ